MRAYAKCRCVFSMCLASVFCGCGGAPGGSGAPILDDFVLDDFISPGLWDVSWVTGSLLGDFSVLVSFDNDLKFTEYTYQGDRLDESLNCYSVEEYSLSIDYFRVVALPVNQSRVYFNLLVSQDGSLFFSLTDIFQLATSNPQISEGYNSPGLEGLTILDLNTCF